MTNTKDYNRSTYFFLHFISGVNNKVIGENLINTYIDKNQNKYNLYVLCRKEEKLLQCHSDLITSVIVDKGILYVFPVANEWHTDYTLFKKNKAEGVSTAFKEMAYSLSGEKFRSPDGKGGFHYLKLFMMIDDSVKGYGVIEILAQCQDFYDYFIEIPYLNHKECGKRGIHTWDDYDNLILKVNSDKHPRITHKDILALVDENYSLLQINEENFIENIMK